MKMKRCKSARQEIKNPLMPPSPMKFAHLYFNKKFHFEDPKTGAHFNYKEVCRKLEDHIQSFIKKQTLPLITKPKGIQEKWDNLVMMFEKSNNIKKPKFMQSTIAELKRRTTLINPALKLSHINQRNSILVSPTALGKYRANELLKLKSRCSLINNAQKTLKKNNAKNAMSQYMEILFSDQSNNNSPVNMTTKKYTESLADHIIRWNNDKAMSMNLGKIKMFSTLEGSVTVVFLGRII